MLSHMFTWSDFDASGPYLIVLGPDVGPPIQNAGEINILWGVEPPIESKNGLKMTFLMVPRPLALHAPRYRHGEQFWKGFEAQETEF